MKSFVCFEGEEEAAAAKAAAEAAAKAAAGKKFDQDEVNTFLAKEKRKTQEVQRQLATQLEEAKKSAALTVEERDDLQKQIDELQNKYMTTEERARQEAEKTKDAHVTEIKTLTTERNAWQSRYTKATIDVEITQAAVANKAISSEQIAALLRPATKLTEKTDEVGKPNGAFEARVAFNDTDKDGKSITLDLTVPEAVKRLSELEAHGNLFESGKTGGLGGSGNSSKKKGDVDVAKIAKENDSAQYRKLRKEKPELFGR